MPKKATEYVNAPDGLPARVVQPWAGRKHHFLERYADIFSVGMKNKFSRRAYLDLLAGPGICYEPERREFFESSPLIGLRRNFTDHIYVDLDPVAVEALRERMRPRDATRYVHVLPASDCNACVDAVIERLPKYGLTFAFIDPTNWQISFDTIRRITEARRVDFERGPRQPRVARLAATHSPGSRCPALRSRS